MINRIKSWFKTHKQLRNVAELRGQMLEKARERYLELRAKYDSAQNSLEHQRHWQHADDLSPARASNAGVRYVLRNRSRYEVLENNSYGLGMVLQKSNDVIGRGPNLRVKNPLIDKEILSVIEHNWTEWADEIGLGEVLRTAYLGKMVVGESFFLPSTNRNLDHPVKLDIRLIEADQVSHPQFNSTGSTGFDDFDPLTTDGIHFDKFGHPVAYDILKDHPGGGLFHNDFDTVPAKQVIHYFRRDRPSQPRGVPETTSALPLFAYLRRFTLATIAAAEIAADFAGVLQTDAGAIDEQGANFAPLAPEEIMDIDRGSMVSLPWGWKLEQVRAEHPNTTHVEFAYAILNEIARCLQMPFNRAIGNSTDYTFASGKLDKDAYLDHIDVERGMIEKCVLRRIFRWWLDEAMFVPGMIPEGIGQLLLLKPDWIWPAHRESDPQAQAAADITYWRAGLLTDEDFVIRQGKDIDDHYDQLERQIEKRKGIEAPLPEQKGSSGTSEAKVDQARSEDTTESADEAETEQVRAAISGLNRSQREQLSELVGVPI